MSARSRVVIVAAVTLFISPAVRADVVVEGRILGHDDEPMTKAHVEVVRPAEGSVVVGGQADPDGHFALSFEVEGFVLLRLAGVNHEAVELPLVLDGTDEIRVDARLRTYEYADFDGFDTIPLIGDVNRWSRGRPAQMRRDFGGTWYAEFEWDTIAAYQLMGIVPGWSTEGTEAIDYVYDGGGSYRALVQPVDGVLGITFDPAKLVRSDRERRIEIDDAHAGVLEAEPIYARMANRRDRYFQSRARSRPGQPNRFEEVKAEIAAEFPSLVTAAREESDAGLRKLRFIEVLQVARMIEEDPDEALLQECLDENPASSPYWSAASEVVGYVVTLTGGYPARTDYLLEIADHHPDPELRKLALVRLSGYASNAGRTEEVGLYVKRLQDEFPGGPWDKYLPPPESEIEKGKPVPSYHVVSLDDSTSVFTPEAFAGNVVLLDFWATWCQPCVREMPALHAAYEEFHERGLEILSLSLDRRPGPIQPFRARWPMPWQHAFLTGGFENPMARAFEVRSIPKPVLVGPDGIIIAVGRELRGSNLERTLAAALDGTD